MDETLLIVLAVLGAILLFVLLIAILSAISRHNEEKTKENKRQSFSSCPWLDPITPSTPITPEPKSRTDYIGEEGEDIVDSVLKEVQEINGGEVYKNLILEDIHGNCTEIDNIYVSDCGIFVIETKNWGGRIYGDKNDEKWENVLGDGSIIHTRENPFRQNDRHVRFFERVIHTRCEVTPIVAFVSYNAEEIECEEVILSDELKDYILKFEYQELDDSEYRYVVGRLNHFKNNPPMTHNEYVKWQRQHFNK